MTKPSGRQTADDWIQAGFRALATRGPSALKAEALAREIGTTKGSFYWHFADLADFKARLLAHWEARAFDEIVDKLETTPDPVQRLRQLCILAVSFRDPAYGSSAAEPALRAWAREDGNVAEAVRRMDQRRLAYLDSLCRSCGLRRDDAGTILYAVFVGLENMDGEPEIATQTILGLLDALGLPDS
ncbi:MAG: TetR/AcrR family transcriptional regulator [Hoeflea sp.]|uniref:TetR/AcrR family transcriptional regulator n=1 Tax=Hoeflea sp. TaxID=1940281 RepID=UPI001DCD402F|nr:TetR/AcrR family transcriptional regulator [Hoeflea sp.]MBU4529408.1 TetR/AcrR family transcriptional regulator [Alphaproteobacteria bacterium]MBU4546527.1 TetR/AcrR family transcriptional regulator [Alphaproteobacteria bacterium]MBU4550795.1 TetR/AcrR family transcriptional regulator [Alphaproteobacteria bacterium]MBV1723737.1 TetR/AcrR family transcriptional regulator [Hoeflea sp.]MBV1763014.1 TetR/AcrR family transcriptional regulator [Hoeflea sp.]